MSSSREDEKIPDEIMDKQSNRTYIKGRFFGKGGFAKCYEITENGTNNVYAGKIVSKKLLAKSNHKAKIVQEISIHQSLKHKHVVGFHNFFDDDQFVYVVLELCRKRSMMELHRRRKTLTEPECRYFMKQILNGVQYLHDNNIIHRDLKLGNLFLNDNIEVKIGDFGLATKIEYNGQRKETVCGTPNYIAPEIITKKGHSFEVDIWSIGCIMYTLLVGKPPFETQSLRETYDRIKKCQYGLPLTLKSPAVKLIKAMLQANPEKRPTVQSVQKFEWFRSGYTPAELPISCLTMAPRFDFIASNESSYLRKPLVEVNNGALVSSQTSGIKPTTSKSNPRLSIVTSGEGGLKPDTKEECRKLLRNLTEQLEALVAKTPCHKMNMPEEMSDPAAQPIVWVSRWVDYSDKYGFGYQLCDDGVGIMFNDNTRLILLQNEINVHYIERDGTELYYTVDSVPAALEKKMKLLSYFQRYMFDHLMKAGADHAVQQPDSLSRIPYLQQWHRSATAVLMFLTNGTLQINFKDHTKMILCPLMSAVTYIDEQNNFNTYRFSTIADHGCTPALSSCLEYAKRKMHILMQPLSEK